MRFISPGRLMILGDFNFHVEDPTDADANKFLDLITSFSLVQRVHGPTHEKGRTLDLVITRSDDMCNMDFSVNRILLSDHSLISYISDVSRPGTQKITRTSRNVSSITKDALIDRVNLHKMTSSEDASGDDLVMEYNRTLTRVVDELAPEKTKVYRDKPRAPWITDQIRDVRPKLCHTEQNWRNHPLETNRQIFFAERLEYNSWMTHARTIIDPK